MCQKIMHASKVGFPCDRNLWYAVNGHEEVISEKSQRTFDIGTALEPLVIKWLEKDGWEIEYNPGSQDAEKKAVVKVSGGNLVGHPDAFVYWGDEILVIDIKTMNDRAFKLWRREGTLKKYPQYVDQLHVYAKGLLCENRNIQEVKELAIVGVNKNTSEVHIDYFEYDENRMNEIISRTERIFALDEAPETGENMQDWCCSYCGYKWICELYHEKHDISVGSEITSTEDITVIDAVELLKEARELSKTGEELENEAKKVLDENVRQQGIKAIKCGNFLLTLKECKGKRIFDIEGLSKVQPDLAKQFTRISNPYIKYEIKEVF